MFRNPRVHFLQSVRASYIEYFNARRANTYGQGDLVRRATQAASALYHMREHLSPGPDDATLTALCPDFALVQDITNATKHNSLSRGKPRISKAEQITEVTITTFYKDTEGEYPNAQVDVVAKLDDGTERSVSEIIHNVMSMWCTKLDALGVIKIKNPELSIYAGHVDRTVASNRVDMRVTQGEEFIGNGRIRRFNYQTNASEPVSLAGATAELRIFKAIDKVPMVLTLPDGRTGDFDVPLTPEEGYAFVHLTTDEQRQAFLDGVLKNLPKPIKITLSDAPRPGTEQVEEKPKT